MVAAPNRSRNKTVTRNAPFFKKSLADSRGVMETVVDKECEVPDANCNKVNSDTIVTIENPPQYTRQVRVRKEPIYLEDYVLY